MVQTYSSNKKIYSVDMMFSYLNLFSYPVTTIDIKKYLYTLDFKGWGDPSKNIFYSPMDVINNPNNKEYANEINRIKEADLSYPIIADSKHIIDGVHRLTKAYLNGNKTLKAYIFSKQLMNKFLINNKGDWNKVNKIQTYHYIQLFYQRFCK